MKAHGLFWCGAAVAMVVVALITIGVDNQYVFYAGYVILEYIALATAWNILGGYAGYVNFGVTAFFGLGTYVSVALLQHTAAPLLVQMLAGAVAAGLLGLGTGLLTLRLRGIYFAIATIGVAIILETSISNIFGSSGIQLLRPPVIGIFGSYEKMLFFVMALLAVGAVAIARYIETSWIGRGLKAIRDDEQAAECCGIPTLKLKLFACVVSGMLMGAVGSMLPMYLSFAETASTFDMNYTVSTLAMAIMGGTEGFLGPVIGALLLATIQQIVTVTISSELNLLVVGVLLVLTVVIAPNGVLGLFRRLRGKKAVAREAALKPADAEGQKPDAKTAKMRRTS
jgi:branched-chain amino acid transport system permease protein